MQIHVARNSTQLGVFAPEEIVAGLSSGRFHASDLAWRDGLPNWTPLGDWAEFRVAGVPASPRAAIADAPAVSTIPWEQGKSLGSFFATIKLSIANPSALSTGRFAFGDWVVFCYLALAFYLPFQMAHVVMVGDQNAAIAEALSKIDAPWAKAMADQMAKAPPTSAGLAIFSAIMGLAFAPLIYAGCALAHWVGQRLFRIKVPVERTVAATLLACGMVILLGAPLQLLGFSLLAQMLLSCAVLVPACVLYFRAFGGATGVSPWKQFGISCLVWFVLCCCCCVLPIALLSGAMASVALR
ncbi:hypothetical protein EMGBS6_10180 [Opitutia bacterium]|nr:hypothetical protein EMGBS6_10180 [Opitutae bacterium]